MKNGYLYRVAIEGLLAAVCVLVIFSCMSFDMGDAPSRYAWPHNEPAANWCGAIGAFFSYYLLYFIGPGVFVLLFTSLWVFGVHLSGKSIKYWKKTLTPVAYEKLKRILKSYTINEDFVSRKF